MAGDLTDIAHVQDLVKRHIERYGGLDILVNNASKQILCSDFAEIDLNNVESTFRSNTLAMHALVKYALTHMKRGASIIQTSSMTAYKGSKGMVDYSFRWAFPFWGFVVWIGYQKLAAATMATVFWAGDIFA
ncbi:unnamed protein product [Tilletia laevis]|uniref:Oxidoreductase n=1 Tax=Tilletia laevis TaxID=157183 RepID=A0A9N8LRW9_9BASI|nr:hypothetical protein CF336_g6091 [Tilletia laevis]CAD6909292.1 unnamed protein product [Tilletia controversa]CAD6922459.1 unnamed protein product [Tilletia laevis]CAD6928892.1 unnamed protein product [Tilletia laevis]CAD6977549.1 unnamed protein product [Tilletia controversa]